MCLPYDDFLLCLRKRTYLVFIVMTHCNRVIPTYFSYFCTTLFIFYFDKGGLNLHINFIINYAQYVIVQ